MVYRRSAHRELNISFVYRILTVVNYVFSVAPGITIFSRRGTFQILILRPTLFIFRCTPFKVFNFLNNLSLLIEKAAAYNIHSARALMILIWVMVRNIVTDEEERLTFFTVSKIVV